MTELRLLQQAFESLKNRKNLKMFYKLLCDALNLYMKKHKTEECSFHTELNKLHSLTEKHNLLTELNK